MEIFLNLRSCLSKKGRNGAPLQNHQTDLLRQLNKFEKGKDERSININLPPRPPFQAPKYLIVLGQLCCFVGRASVDPFYKTTPVPAQWRPCLVAPHCPRNGRLQRILNFFSTTGSSRLTELVHCALLLLEKGMNPEFRLVTWHVDGLNYTGQSLIAMATFCLKSSFSIKLVIYLMYVC